MTCATSVVRAATSVASSGLTGSTSRSCARHVATRRRSRSGRGWIGRSTAPTASGRSGPTDLAARLVACQVTCRAVDRHATAGDRGGTHDLPRRVSVDLRATTGRRGPACRLLQLLPWTGSPRRTTRRTTRDRVASQATRRRRARNGSSVVPWVSLPRRRITSGKRASVVDPEMSLLKRPRPAVEDAILDSLRHPRTVSPRDRGLVPSARPGRSRQRGTVRAGGRARR